MAEVVPTNGFINPAPASAPQPPSGFAVPPAGPPARIPSQTPVSSPSQQPGWVSQVPPQQQQQQEPAQQQPVQQQQQQQAPDMAQVVQMLQAALGNQAGQAKPEGTPAQQIATEAEKPGWVPQDLNATDIAGIDDPIIKSMASVMQVVGKDIDLNRVLSNALSHGDPQLIDLAYLYEKAPAQAAQLAEIAKGIVQAVNAKSEAITAEVYSTVGGEAVWNSAVAAFNQTAPQALKLTVQQMLNSTKVDFIKAGAQIVAEFGKASGLIPQQGANLLNSAAAGMQGQGLTRSQFQEELRKLNPNSQGYNEAREALFARRSLGKRVGL